MADPDPESEALIRKLHRELNGLTRRSRGHDTHPAIAAAKARKALQSKKSYESGDGSEDFSEKAMHSKPSSTEERVSADHPSKHLKRDRGACSVAQPSPTCLQNRPRHQCEQRPRRTATDVRGTGS